MITAKTVLSTLTTGDPCPDWIRQAAAYIDPPRYGGTYETTAVNFFPEVTVRLPVAGTTRRGKQKLQRRRFDLIGFVQTHYKNFEPVTVGVEIKVDRNDLLNDEKLTDYLPYVHLMYLGVPPDLEDDALNKLGDIPWSTIPAADSFGPIGLLIVDELDVTISHHPDLLELEKRFQPQPTDKHLRELYAELLLRPFKLAKKEQQLFIQFV
jgi:hypothetical protein